jgi:hypothetical protein
MEVPIAGRFLAFGLCLICFFVEGEKGKGKGKGTEMTWEIMLLEAFFEAILIMGFFSGATEGLWRIVRARRS